MTGEPGVPPPDPATPPEGSTPPRYPAAAPDAAPSDAPAAVPQPLVAWEPPAPAAPAPAGAAAGYAGGAPPFTVGALLSDTFARYGADLLRLFVVSAVGSGLSWLSSFAAPMGPNPFGRPTGFVDVGGLLGLLSFVAGFVGSSVMLALAEGGRDVEFGRAIRRGVERSGWLFLTSLLLGVAFFALFLLALIPLGLFFVISPVLVIIPIVALFLVFLWASLRLVLSLPAIVADNNNSIEALKLSWRVTKPSGVWLRLLGASFVLGLMVAPAALGALLLVFPAIFGGGGQRLLVLVPAVAFALFTPLSLLLSYSAYRRLVPPAQPSSTAPPVAPTTPAGLPLDAPAPDAPTPDAPAPDAPGPDAPAIGASPPPPSDAPAVPVSAPAPDAALPPSSADPESPSAAPAFHVPRLGTAGKALIALILAFDVAGIAAIPYGVAQMETWVRDGFPGLPGAPGSPGLPGFPGGENLVFPGQVAFGSNANLDGCTIENQLFFATAGTSVEWIASLERPVTPQDEVFLLVTRDGQVLETTVQDPGAYDCLGSAAPVPGLADGVYTYEILVNGTTSAHGSLIVQ